MECGVSSKQTRRREMSNYTFIIFAAVTTIIFAKQLISIYRKPRAATFWRTLNAFYYSFKIGLLAIPPLIIADAQNAGLLEGRIIDPWTGITLFVAFFTWLHIVISEAQKVIEDELRKAERLAAIPTA